jgi:hypothetical protein
VFLAVQLRRIAGRAGTANIESKVGQIGQPRIGLDVHRVPDLVRC